MKKDTNLRDQTLAHVAHAVSQLIWLGTKRFAQQFSAYGLTVPQYFTLFFLWHQSGPCCMQTLAEITHQDAATLTGIINRLTRLGYVSRQRGQDDRRKVYVALEKAGRCVIQEMRAGRRAGLRHRFAALSQDDLDEMLRLLDVLLLTWQSEETKNELEEQ